MSKHRTPRVLTRDTIRVMEEHAQLIAACDEVQRLAESLRRRYAKFPPRSRLHWSSEADARDMVRLFAGVGWQAEVAGQQLANVAPTPAMHLSGAYDDE